MYSFSRKTPLLSVIFFVLLFTVAYGEVYWTSYNDCVRGSGDTTAVNVTDWTIYNGYTTHTTGLLVDFNSGSQTPVTATFTWNSSLGLSTSSTGGSQLISGTPAYAIFGGIVDFSNNFVSYGSDTSWWVEITFTGLNPYRQYTFVTTAIRAADYPTRMTLFTLSGHTVAENNSSNGVYLKNGAQTVLVAAGNHTSTTGYVVRWDNIRVDAAGTFKVRAEPYSTSGADWRAYSFGGFMLQEVTKVNMVPTAEAGNNQTIIQPKEYLTLNGSVSDDGLGDPEGYLQSTWSQVSGPQTVQFITDIHQLQVTARFPAIGQYQLRLSVTDGLLNSSDDVTVTVEDAICPVGDMNADCIVGFSDLEQLVIAWLEDTETSPPDLNGDARVDIDELSLLSQSWLENWTGSLQVTILPAEAIAAGAQWRLDGGDWQSSGTMLSEIPEGTHQVEFSPNSQWANPDSQTVEIIRQQTTAVLGQYTRPLVISEFLATNSYIPYVNPMDIYTYYSWNTTDPSGKVYPDWIELYNDGSEAINLAGWYLTDDPDDKTKWQFPSTMGSALILQPGQFLIVFASNKGADLFPSNYPYVDYYGALHTNFKLSTGGGYLAAVAQDGLTVSYEYNDYPEQYPFVSYGISQNRTIGYLMTPTPGTRVNNKWAGGTNSASYTGKVSDTKFSHHRGFYESPFDVTITCDTAGAEIHYTLDGTVPQPTVGGYTLLYSGAIPISSTKCLRAKAFKAGFLSSNTDTQTYLFLDNVVTQVRPADPRYVTSWEGTTADYAMENNTTDIKLVAGNSGYTEAQAKAVIKNALEQIPTLSIVTNPDNLFGSVNGIYTHTNPNPTDPSILWERPVSAEYFAFDPNRTEPFQIDCGLRMQGGMSRYTSNSPKHSLSLRFSGGYGDSTLKRKLFPHTSVEEFDSLQLRAVYNNSWTIYIPAQRTQAELIRDQFIRDSLIAMGQESAGDGTYVHLYLNGLYWGVYNVHERQDASHYAAYYGGDGAFYDAVKGNEIEDGDSDEWNRLQSTASNVYYANQAEWEAITAVLDVENYIDWTIIQHYGHNRDLKSNDNWRAAGGGVFGVPWQYYAWDVERTMEDNTGGWPEPYYDFSSPFLFGPLINFGEFRIQFADRLYKHFHNQGALTANVALARFNARVDELNDAIIGESARWGDYWGPLYTRNGSWLPAINTIRSYFPGLETNVINHFRDWWDALYPAIEPPVFKINSVQQSGGDVSVPYTFDMVNTNGVGQVYYTLDGTDPRAYWTGNISGTAILYNGIPIQLNKSVTVKARVRDSWTWSALHEATYADQQIAGSLRITELMYHSTGFNADPNLEFIELKNIGTAAINLNLVQFTNGITHTFGNVSVAAGGFVLLVKNKTVFEAHYTSLPVGVPVIQWTQGELSNAGEKITVKDALGRTIQSFSYKDSWYPLTDGDGFSLSIRDPLNSDLTLWDQKIGWRASTAAGGSPGANEIGLAPDSIVINELLAHSSGTETDWIELYNTTAQSISIGGWFISDDADNLTKYEIPENTEIAAGDYVVFYEGQHFGSVFALSGNGETVYLTSGAGGQITGYQVSQQFDASEEDISLGWYIKSDDNMDFVAMSSLTPGAANAYPAVGPIVISEIQYNPAAGNTGDEYLELHNISSQAVTLQDTVDTEVTPGVYQQDVVSWTFTDGIDFTFPAGTHISAGGFLIIAKNPTEFSAYYTGLPSGTPVLGPFENGTALSNGGEKVRLSKPGEQPLGKPRSWIRVDQVTYDDQSPWPITPDGNGATLQRMNQSAYGNDPNNWTAASPNPGQ